MRAGIGMTQGIGNNRTTKVTKNKTIRSQADQAHGKEQEQHHHGTSRTSIQLTKTQRSEERSEARIETAECSISEETVNDYRSMWHEK